MRPTSKVKQPLRRQKLPKKYLQRARPNRQTPYTKEMQKLKKSSMLKHIRRRVRTKAKHRRRKDSKKKSNIHQQLKSHLQS